MGTPFLTAEDCRMRLDGTICEYDGKPVRVETLPSQGANDIRLWPLRKNPLKSSAILTNVSDTKFLYHSLPLGYITYEHVVYYLTRVPQRQTKAGLAQDNLHADPYPGNVNFLMTSKAMEECILGIHPPLAEAAVRARKWYAEMGHAHNGCAFHRHLAVMGNGRVFYRNRAIGEYIFDRETIILDSGPAESFMSRILDRLGVLR